MGVCIRPGGFTMRFEKPKSPQPNNSVLLIATHRFAVSSAMFNTEGRAFKKEWEKEERSCLAAMKQIISNNEGHPGRSIIVAKCKILRRKGLPTQITMSLEGHFLSSILSPFKVRVKMGLFDIPVAQFDFHVEPFDSELKDCSGENTGNGFGSMHELPVGRSTDDIIQEGKPYEGFLEIWINQKGWPFSPT